MKILNHIGKLKSMIRKLVNSSIGPASSRNDDKEEGFLSSLN